MVQNTTGQTHNALQAFTSLLTLVDALAAIPEQEKLIFGRDGNTLPITLSSAGTALASITHEVLNCCYVAVFALDPPDERQRLLGVSGLSSNEEQTLLKDTYQVPLNNYVSENVFWRLRTNQAVLLDLKQEPFVTTRSAHGARYRLVAPMMLHDRLIGLFSMAKTDANYANIHQAYTEEEIALAQGIAKLAAQVIERVSLLQEQAVARNTEERLQVSNRLYEDILTATSHELRTPLTTIKGNVQLSLRRAKTLEKQATEKPITAENLHRIEQPLEYAMRHFSKMELMIREMLDDSRIQAGKFDMLMRPANLVEIVQKAVTDVQRLVSEREINFIQPAENDIPVIADTARIGEVVNNYLSNALKYAPSDSPIEVKLTANGRRARVTVRDEGPGLAQASQAHIWERFYRALEVEPPPELGYIDANLGLGLYLCKEIIERHHGQLGVESIPGRGATFWFTLPLASTPAKL